MWIGLSGCAPAEPEGVDARDLDPYADGALCEWHLGNPEVGQELFERPVLGSAAGCVTCHSLEPEVTLVGPSLYGAATTAANRVEGVRADNYLYLSITLPNFHVVEGYQPDIMPHSYATELTQLEITDLVSFLMTLTVSESP
ncbi:MAG: cytochrome c [Anaerolineales bacterium]|nr:cytochrome c [Anaerolineales bacterium]